MTNAISKPISLSYKHPLLLLLVFEIGCVLLIGYYPFVSLGILFSAILFFIILGKIDYVILLFVFSIPSPLPITPSVPKLILLLLVGTYIFNTIILSKPFSIKLPMFPIIASLLITSSISILNATYIKTSLSYMSWYIGGFLLSFYIIINNTKTQKEVYRITAVIVAISVIQALLGIFRIGHISNYRVFGFIGGNFGSFVGLALILSISFVVFGGINKFHRLLYLVLIPILILALFLSQTRAWIIGTVVAMIVLVLYVPNKVRLSLLGVALVILLSFFLIGKLNLGSSEVKSKAIERVVGSGSEQYTYSFADISMAMRIFLWFHIVDYFMEHPIIGNGIGNLRFSDPWTGKRGEPKAGNWYCDNHYLAVLGETGILGFISWMWLIISTIKIAVENIKLSGEDRCWKAISVGLFAGIWVFLLGGSMWVLTPSEATTLFFSTFIALIVSSNLVIKSTIVKTV